MPILTDIMDHDLFGPLLCEIATARAEGFAGGFAEGFAEGLVQEGLVQEGLVEGGRAYLHQQIARRFGTPPDCVSQRINELGLEQLEDFAVRLMDTRSLEEPFGAELT